MKVKNLDDIKVFITHSVYTSLLLAFILAIGILGFIYNYYADKQALSSRQHIDSIIKLYESNLSEKLSIIASSSIFLDYINSGPVSREALSTDFLFELSSLKSDEIVGMTIDDLYRNNVFTSGAQASNEISLQLCYLDSLLDSQLGQCRYTWTLYLDTNRLLSNLLSQNQDLEKCINCEAIPLFTGKSFGSFPMVRKSNFYVKVRVKQNNSYFIYLFSVFLLVTLIAFAAWNRYRAGAIINKFIASPLSILTRKLKEKRSLEPNQDYIDEISFLNNQISSWQKEVSSIQEQKKQVEIGKIALQVSHDIRSPLAALEMVSKDLSNIPENQRNVIRSVTQRISDIANNLLTDYRNDPVKKNLEVAFYEAEPIVTMIDSIVSEKRVQHAARGILFKLEVQDEVQGEFIKVDPVAFKRVLSNLLNNAIEAIERAQGLIMISLDKTSAGLKLVIEDNGIGIPPEVLPRILAGGFTVGKEQGSGLGISYALQCIRDWSGSLDIKSEVNKGTQIKIILPYAKPAEWFVTKLVVAQDSYVVIVDDDNFIHEIWSKRFKTSFTIMDNIKIFKFRSPAEVLHHHTANNLVLTQYLLDYELIGHSQTGLDLIKQLNVASHAMLVTSRYEEPTVRQACQELGVKIIPKSYALYIPIEVVCTSPDLIFIDDSVALTEAWKLQGECAGKRVATFNDIDDFKKVYLSYKKETPIYIDSDLQGEVKGEQFAQWLFKEGYTHLYLATGYESHRFEPLPWIKGIVGKEFPVS